MRDSDLKTRLQAGGDTSLSNEELAVLIQDGDNARILELWQQCNAFVWKQARREMFRLDGRRGVDVNDLVQSGFLAMLDAAKSFDANAGFAFMTLLGFKIKTAFQEAAGCRTKRQMMEPIDSAISLETPLTDEENADVLGDTIPDLAAEIAFDEIAENDRLRLLHNALETALAALPQEQSEALRMKYFEGLPADAKTCQKGLRALRHPNISKELKDFL